MNYRDKLFHAGVGCGITAVGLWLDLHYLIVLFIVGLVMALKEYYDFKHPARHTPDGWDAFVGLMAPLSLGAILEIIRVFA